MRSQRNISALVACTITLFIAGAASQTSPRAQMAEWLGSQLHRPITATQILSTPEAKELDGCKITGSNRAATGGTAISLRCSAFALPQLVLVEQPLEGLAGGGAARALPVRKSATPPVVRAGTRLHADWRSGALHMQLPVIALEPGAEGAEIRVRIENGSRVLRARIVAAQQVSIIASQS